MSAPNRRIRFVGRPAATLGAAKQTTMWRCGVLHDTTGAVWRDDAFTVLEWAQLHADPLFEITDADAEAPPRADGPVSGQAVASSGGDDPSDGALREKLSTMMGALGEDDMTQAGVPRVGPLREALPEHAEAITAELVRELWEARGGNAPAS
jgi:hypothetical protein